MRNVRFRRRSARCDARYHNAKGVRYEYLSFFKKGKIFRVLVLRGEEREREKSTKKEQKTLISPRA